MTRELSKKLLDVLVCPICKSDLDYKKNVAKLICKGCKRNYDVEDCIPIMLPREGS